MTEQQQKVYEFLVKLETKEAKEALANFSTMPELQLQFFYELSTAESEQEQITIVQKRVASLQDKMNELKSLQKSANDALHMFSHAVEEEQDKEDADHMLELSDM